MTPGHFEDAVRTVMNHDGFDRAVAVERETSPPASSAFACRLD